ncbi:unnamed protein product [Orchesella dallaii]|uniref:Uncharacterized protein n=1 Tax=Orchesella dallaii TaxID=48710 RepID=A0ABP1RDZ8_9HEXA
MMNTVFLMQNPAPKIANSISKSQCRSTPSQRRTHIRRTPSSDDVPPTLHKKQVPHLTSSCTAPIQPSDKHPDISHPCNRIMKNSPNIDTGPPTGLNWLLHCLPSRLSPRTNHHITETAV